NRTQHGIVPVLMELKSGREMTRLVEQLTNYEAIVQHYLPYFERLFSALLGEKIMFRLPAEKWLVWKALDSGKDRREDELTNQGIRTVGYIEESGRYQFIVGNKPI